MVTEPVLHGAAYSAYVRIAGLALTEKGVAFRLEPVDIFAPGGPPVDYLERQPFGRIPAFEHAGFRLYETGAIIRYVDEALPGPALQPTDPRARARMNQVIGILDAYLYRSLVWGIYVERVSAPREGRASDEALIAKGMNEAATCLGALDALLNDGDWLAGPALSLADLHAAPMIAYGVMAPEGAALLAARPRLARWWDTMRARSSMAATRPDGVLD